MNRRDNGPNDGRGNYNNYESSGGRDNYNNQPTGGRDNYNNQPTGGRDNYNNQPTGGRDNYNNQPTGGRDNYNNYESSGGRDNYNQPTSGGLGNYNYESSGGRDNYNNQSTGGRGNYNQPTSGGLGNYNYESSGGRDNYNNQSTGGRGNYNNNYESSGGRDNYNNQPTGGRGNYNSYESSGGRRDDYNNPAQADGRGNYNNYESSGGRGNANYGGQVPRDNPYNSGMQRGNYNEGMRIPEDPALRNPSPRGNFQPAMDSQMFRRCGHQIIDWAVNYMQTLPKRLPTSGEKPGWLWKVVPRNPPMRGEPFEQILQDLEAVAVHGMAHWQHPQFFAYFPAGNSWPSILGDIFSNATAGNGQTWVSCPVVTELETIVMDWCCKFLGLPKFFLSSLSEPESEGQGVLQCSASEAIFYSLIWARQDAIRKLKKRYPDKTKAELLNMLVAYCNNECHCCVERGAMMGCVRMRKLKADKLGIVRSHVLRNAILEDVKKGLVPFFHCAIIGSTGVTCSDDLMEVGPLCYKYDMWLHVDGAYAGSAFVLPEMRHLKQGYEYVWSTNINTNKWMMCNFEASLHWVRYRSKAVDCFAGDTNRIRKYPNGVGPDLRHYGVAHSRRLRAVKLYFVIRCYGVKGIRRYIRNHINLAKLFEMYVRRDHRFEVLGGPFRFGLVTFRLKGYNFLTSRLLDAMNASHKIHMVSSHFHDQVVIRFALCAENATERDIDRAWRTIDEFASVILRQYENEHKQDLALRNLYVKQHEHDEMRTMFPDEEVDKEEVEATRVLDKLGMYQKDDEFVHGAITAARDGSWGQGDDEQFSKFDRDMQEHPDKFTLDLDYYDGDGSGKVRDAPSMLHLTTLKATIANNPEFKRGQGVDQGNYRRQPNR